MVVGAAGRWRRLGSDVGGAGDIRHEPRSRCLGDTAGVGTSRRRSVGPAVAAHATALGSGGDGRGHSRTGRSWVVDLGVLAKPSTAIRLTRSGRTIVLPVTSRHLRGRGPSLTGPEVYADAAGPVVGVDVGSAEGGDRSNSAAVTPFCTTEAKKNPLASRLILKLDSSAGSRQPLRQC